jgi:PPK2 family polyphosphate:nucleotide phosphotransferase
MKEVRKLIKELVVPAGRRFRLEGRDPGYTGWMKSGDEEAAKMLLAHGVKQLAKQQDMLYAQDSYAVLVIFQAMDAAGKDGTIRHVMSGVNPQGTEVYSFKAPSAEERDHTYLWRSMKAVPERGRIGIHNRSHYEEVLVARVHKEILAAQQLPESLKGRDLWKRRFREIVDFEQHLAANGVVVIKFFLHVSKAEQKRRFLSRIDEADKNWKFSLGDVHERRYWDKYMDAYEEMLEHTSTESAPWYVVPADHKWFTHLAVAGIIWQTLADLKLSYPRVTKEKKTELRKAKRLLMSERSA